MKLVYLEILKKCQRNTYFVKLLMSVIQEAGSLSSTPGKLATRPFDTPLGVIAMVGVKMEIVDKLLRAIAE